MKRRTAITAMAGVAASSTLLAGCTANMGSGATPAERRATINSGFDRSLGELYQSVPGSKELAARARGVLVFPSVISAGFIFGGEFGEGALRIGGKTVDFYDIRSGSFGFQAGAQSRAVIMMFMTQSALDNFVKANSWTAGADASVAVARAGANVNIDTATAKADIVGFAIVNSGLFGGLSINGSRIAKITI